MQEAQGDHCMPWHCPVSHCPSSLNLQSQVYKLRLEVIQTSMPDQRADLFVTKSEEAWDSSKELQIPWPPSEILLES